MLALQAARYYPGEVSSVSASRDWYFCRLRPMLPGHGPEAAAHQLVDPGKPMLMLEGPPWTKIPLAGFAVTIPALPSQPSMPRPNPSQHRRAAPSGFIRSQVAHLARGSEGKKK